MQFCLKCPFSSKRKGSEYSSLVPTVEGGRSRAGVGRRRLAPRGSAPPCRAPRPNDACTAEGGCLPPRARPRAGGRVFAPSPTLLGPFAPQRVAAAHRGDVAEGFEASCCLPLAMTVRACTFTCATVAQPLSHRRRWASTKWAPKALQRRLADALSPRQPWRRAAPAPPQPLAPGSATLHTALMQVSKSSSRPPSLALSRPPTQSDPLPWP